MSFHERSAWVMVSVLLAGAALYFGAVGRQSASIGSLVHPGAPAVATYTLLLALAAILGHVGIAILTPKAANSRPDEREQRIIERSGHHSSVVLAAGVILSLGVYLVGGDGDLLFYGVFASLMLGQLSEYLARIVLLRAGP